jgi:uncharacterized protein (TIGR00369 family)
MNRAALHDALDEPTRQRWMRFARSADATLFVSMLGLVVEDVRLDYCRMRLPFTPSLLQAGGVVHGGAIASLLDSVVVPVVGQAYPATTRFSTVDMHVQFMSALVDDDAVAEGWVVRRGRTTVFCEAEVRATLTDKIVARSMLTYQVSAPAS